ncbi:MAG: RNA methyltransferase [Christensenellaceae bacterium]|jgi:TrmH family RNA methyltransferase|nr:RNA methyltransferase [Christensenellaceae bacterium]
MERISSTKNPHITKLRSLNKKAGRDEYGEYLVEGGTLITDMPKKMIKQLFVRDDEIQKYDDIIRSCDADVYILGDSLFKVISDTESSSGIIAVADKRKSDIIQADRNIIVLDEMRDAGNLGTVIRMAVAFGVYDIIAINCVDHYNSKVVRSSMGGIFHSNIVAHKDYQQLSDIIGNRCIIGLDSHGTNLYDFRPARTWAIIVGGEVRGLSNESRSIIDKLLAIPMFSDKIESLNAAISVAIATSWFCNIK